MEILRQFDQVAIEISHSNGLWSCGVYKKEKDATFTPYGYASQRATKLEAIKAAIKDARKTIYIKTEKADRIEFLQTLCNYAEDNYCELLGELFNKESDARVELYGIWPDQRDLANHADELVKFMQEEDRLRFHWLWDEDGNVKFHAV